MSQGGATSQLTWLNQLLSVTLQYPGVHTALLVKVWYMLTKEVRGTMLLLRQDCDNNFGHHPIISVFPFLVCPRFLFKWILSDFTVGSKAREVRCDGSLSYRSSAGDHASSNRECNGKTWSFCGAIYMATTEKSKNHQQSMDGIWLGVMHCASFSLNLIEAMAWKCVYLTLCFPPFQILHILPRTCSECIHWPLPQCRTRHGSCAPTLT